MRRANGLCESLDRRARRDATLLQQFTEAALEMLTTVAEHEKRVVTCVATLWFGWGSVIAVRGQAGFVGIDAGSNFEQPGVAVRVNDCNQKYSEEQDKLLLNESAIEEDLDKNWAVVAEGIQTILRREKLSTALKHSKNWPAPTKESPKIRSAVYYSDVSESKRTSENNFPQNYTGVW